ncbi:superoxide dismutase [Phormidium tenue FACHB-886]|nr:superoxide dismutase [Phormidium tenue FACHB-886]
MSFNRRSFLVLLGGSAIGAGIGMARSQANLTWTEAAMAAETPSGPFTLPPLPYDYDALEPHIDAATMQFHHEKHHAAYVNNLNTALQKYPDLQSKSAEDLLRELASLPEDIQAAVRNNGGGHVNHTLFWEIMGPDQGGAPSGAIAEAIDTTFGSFDKFKQQFNEAGSKQFGSGWAWLVKDQQGKLQVISTANQDSPIIAGLTPILGNDVWEHAYYLKYQNRRADYLNAWWNVVNWEEVNRRYGEG